MKTHVLRLDSRLRQVSGWMISLVLHLAAAWVLLAIHAKPTETPTDTIVQMTIAAKKKPEPRVSPPAVEIESKHKKQKPRLVKISKTTLPLPPSNQSKPKHPQKAKSKPVFGISMGSVVEGSNANTPGMKVRVGNTLAKAPEEDFTDPSEVEPYLAANRILKKHAYHAVPTYKLTSLPKPKRLIKADYPEQARIAGIEGEIILRLTIDEEGRVEDAVIVKGIGHGLDELTLAAAKSFRFEPALIENQPVSTIIPFTYRWKIVD